MSFLTPLYVLGLAAISLPILLHLIRRTPKGVQSFSSLMFIVATPPRLTRRSRIDHLLLLLLRAAIVALLAFAFARPFFRWQATADLVDVAGRHVAVLVDTSGSMRRTGVWDAVARELDSVLDDLGPHDDIALYQFAHRVERLVSWEETQMLPPSTRGDLVRQRFSQLRPTWSATALGDAMMRVADDLDALEDPQSVGPVRQLIVISDLQEGSQLEALQAYQWPASVQAIVRPVAAATGNNAAAQLLDAPQELSDEQGVRVRVQNAAPARKQQFLVCWADADARPIGRKVAVTVPPGESRVVRVPRPRPDVTPGQLLLQGDDDDFDNHYFVATAVKTAGTITYVGSDEPDDPQQLLYYLSRAVTNDQWRQVDVVADDGRTLDELADSRPLLVVVSQSLEAAPRDSLRQYLLDGGTVLFILSSADDMSVIAQLAGTELGTAEEVVPADYALWSSVDFGHSLLRPLANSRYNDFSMIHFWKYRRVTIPDDTAWKTLITFDSGDPALITATVGRGVLYILTSGWTPADSQLARSSKFVPLLSGMLERDASQHGGSYAVDEPMIVPRSGAERSDEAGETLVTGPGDLRLELPADAHQFEQTSRPGLYQLQRGDQSRTYSVNLTAAETRTSPLDPAELEQRGVRLGEDRSRGEQLAALEQMRDIELEASQHAWQWIIAAALLILILETVLAGRWAAQQEPSQPSQAASG